MANLALEIFKLVGSIFVDSDAADKSLQKTDEKAGGVGKTLLNGIGTATKWGTAIVGGATAAVTAVSAFAMKTAETTDEIDKMSQKIGVSREAYQELDYILSQNGMDVNILQTGLKTMTDQMDITAQGTSKTATAFERLGISVTDSSGELRDKESVFYDTITALQGMTNEAERTALANDIFGRSASELAPLLNSGAESMDALKQKAHDLGLVLSDETIDAGVSLTDTIDTLKRSFGAIMTELGAALMPIIQKVAEYIIASMPKIQALIQRLEPIFTQLLDGLLPPLLELAEQIFPILFDLLEALIPPIAEIVSALLPVIVELIRVLLPPIIQIVKTILPVLLQLIEPLIPLLIPIIQLLTPILNIVITLLDPLLKLINLILPILVEYLGDSLSNALSALAPLFEGIGVAVGFFADMLTNIIDFIVNVFTGNWDAAWENVKNAFQNYVDYFNTIWDTMKKVLGTVWETFTKPFREAWDGIKKVFEPVTDFFEGVFNEIKSLFKLPHFTFSGSLNPLEWAEQGLPSIGVEWYRKGGVMLDPTLMGYNANTGNAMVGGEAGPEAIAPIETLKAYIKEAVNSTEQVTLLTAILSMLKQLNEGLYDQIVDALVDGVRFEVDDRELGRLVKSYA